MLKNDDKVIIIDSSDLGSQSQNLQTISRISYVITDVKSAAIQRNIGIDLIGPSDYVFFLDDDVIPPKNYFSDCVKTLEDSRAVGMSGVAINPQKINTFAKKKSILHRIFLLDSSKSGSLLKSGVNVPIRTLNSGVKEVEWLIGCSAWVYSAISDTRFETDFMGQSLGEDVIFSTRMKSKGKLVTNSKILLIHEESMIERPTRKDFWENWVQSRYRIIQVAKFGKTGAICFWWSNLGQFLVLAFLKLIRRNYVEGSLLGLLVGFVSILRGKNEN
jgi:GT2 family glycosyltransferase